VLTCAVRRRTIACATLSFKFSTISPQSVSVWPIAVHRAGERVPGGAERHLQLRLSRLSQPRAKRDVCPRVCLGAVWQTSKAKPLAVRELQPLRDRTHVATAVRTTIPAPSRSLPVPVRRLLCSSALRSPPQGWRRRRGEFEASKLKHRPCCAVSHQHYRSQTPETIASSPSPVCNLSFSF
jgi:hypothetical protein